MRAKRLADLQKLIPVVECFVQSGNKVLLFKRSDQAKRFPGFWIGPGGHIDWNEDPVTAIIREMKEETGLDLKPESLKLRANVIHHHLDRDEAYLVWIFLAKIKQLPDLISSDEGFCQWINLEDLPKMENFFPASRYYHDHIFGPSPKVLYHSAEAVNGEIKKSLSRQLLI